MKIFRICFNLFGEYEVLVGIRELTVYVGEFPSKPLKKVMALVKKNQSELLEEFYQFNPELKP